MTHLKLISAGIAAVLASALLAACASSGRGDVPTETEALARGGRLYDNWVTETGSAAPETTHPLYPRSGEYASKPSSTWRCKECHGWDYLGKDGAYASGKHATGIAGIRNYAEKDVTALVAVLKDPTHGYAGRMSDTDLHDVALFVKRGQVAMSAHIDAKAKTVRGGNLVRGQAHYATLCVGCHGADGKHEDMPVLGDVARSNPWETLHKILNGQPGSAMPALRSLDRQVSLDILTYVQTLPAKE